MSEEYCVYQLKIEMLVETVRKCEVDTYYDNLKKRIFISFYTMLLIIYVQRDGDYLSSHDVFMKRIKTAFQGFVESTERSCREKLVLPSKPSYPLIGRRMKQRN